MGKADACERDGRGVFKRGKNLLQRELSQYIEDNDTVFACCQSFQTFSIRFFRV